MSCHIQSVINITSNIRESAQCLIYDNDETSDRQGETINRALEILP
ncbi:MAG: hypothetical protein F6K09_15415 [Merismopedia sp. SIO2A8]|nr:hypothetical protein [Merismopedia sp. SIO2A8]